MIYWDGLGFLAGGGWGLILVVDSFYWRKS